MTSKPCPASRPVVEFDVTNLIRCLEKPTPTGIDRVDYTYARFLSRCGWVDLRPVYVKGRVLHPVHAREFSQLLITLHRQWSGKSRAAAPSPLFSHGTLELIRRFLRRLRGFKRIPHGTHHFYLNISQRNLSHPAVVERISAASCEPVSLIHDLLPLTHPEFFPPGSPESHKRKLHAVMTARATMICSSETLREELRKHSINAGFPNQVVIRSPFGSGRAAPGPASAESQPPHFLIIGTFEPRKNHRFLIEVWKQVITGSSSPPTLVMTGRTGPASKDMNAALLQDPTLARHVKIIEGAGDAEISTLIKQATAVLIPSFVEGYGLPLFESFSRKTPVIGSDLPVFHELGRGIPLLLLTENPESWADAILNFAPSGEQDRQRQLLQNWQRPTWAAHFRHIIRELD